MIRPMSKKEAEQTARLLRGHYCICWFSVNTGPNGQCEKCGKPRRQGINDHDILGHLESGDDAQIQKAAKALLDKNKSS